MDACTLTLYQRNIFRVTGLPVDSTVKDVAKHAQKLQMLAEMTRTQKAQESAFALAKPPNSEQIRDALTRMKEPELRLIDEFFWYWPEKFGASKEDEAVQFALSGDGDRAINVWIKREDEGSVVAMHNLAIIYHMYGVEWTNYQVTADLEPGRSEKIQEYWNYSLSRWEKLAESDELWDILKQRVRSLDDEALTLGFVRRMRKILPQALDRINAEAALKFGELGWMDWARLHVDYMHQTHQGEDDVESTCELVLSPTRKRVEQQLSAAREEAERKPEAGAKLATEIMGRCKPLMGIYDVFYDKDAHQRNELFDEVAETVNRLQVVYHKKTDDHEMCILLLKQALSFATQPQLRNQIARNISTLEGNRIIPLYKILKSIGDSAVLAAGKFIQIKTKILPLLPGLATEVGINSDVYTNFSDSVAIVLRSISIDAHNKSKDFETSDAAIKLAMRLAFDGELKKRIEEDIRALEDSKKDALCHFCGLRPGEDACVSELAMYGDVSRSYNKVHYRTLSISVPRCRTCKEKQGSASSLGCGLWVASAIIGALIGAAMTKDGGFVGGFVGLLVGFAIFAISKHQGDSAGPNGGPGNYPAVKKMLAQGWKIGNSPGKYG